MFVLKTFLACRLFRGNPRKVAETYIKFSTADTQKADIGAALKVCHDGHPIVQFIVAKEAIPSMICMKLEVLFREAVDSITRML